MWLIASTDHNLLLNDKKTEAIIITAPNSKHLHDVSWAALASRSLAGPV